MKLFDFL